jgi:hypothetical protein
LGVAAAFFGGMLTVEVWWMLRPVSFAQQQRSTIFDEPNFAMKIVDCIGKTSS